jgi:subtilisin family serine protease
MKRATLISATVILLGLTWIRWGSNSSAPVVATEASNFPQIKSSVTKAIFADPVSLGNKTNQIQDPNNFLTSVPSASAPLFPRCHNPPGRELFADAPIVAKKETILDSKGEFERVRIVKTGEPYAAYARIESKLRYDSSTGKEIVLRTSASVADEVLVTVNSHIKENGIIDLIQPLGGKILNKLYAMNTYQILLPEVTLDGVPNAIQYFSKQTQQIKSADQNGFVFATVIPNIPNDTSFSTTQWPLNKVTGAGIDAPEAWSITTGSTSTIVAVCDTGLSTNHPDISANLWKNSKELTNGIDDDHNSFTNDYYGWNFISNNNNVFDNAAPAHGTHVSGTIGAVGNNSKGVAGVCWTVKIIPIKVLGADGIGTDAAVANGINYAVTMGAHIINLSLGGNSDNAAAQIAVARAESNGILICAAAGNETSDNDLFPTYPASYLNNNIISVANSKNTGLMSGSSNYGLTSVDLAAPGDSIYSTVRWTGSEASSYSYLSGTSMASPHVAGVAALLKSARPGMKAELLKEIILNSVDPAPSLVGKCVTGGRLNAYKALLLASAPLSAPTGLVATAVSTSRINLSWTDVKNEIGYRVECSPDGISWKGIGVIGANQTTLNHYPLAIGTAYYYRAQSINDAGYSTFSNIASTSTWTAFQDWKNSNLGSIATPDLGDSDNDGISNLLEYAFNLDPNVRNVNGSSLMTTTDTNLTLTYTRARNDLTYSVEVSTDLKNWSTLGVDQGVIGPTVTASVPVGIDNRKFLRLRVSAP